VRRLIVPFSVVVRPGPTKGKGSVEAHQHVKALRNKWRDFYAAYGNANLLLVVHESDKSNGVEVPGTLNQALGFRGTCFDYLGGGIKSGGRGCYCYYTIWHDGSPTAAEAVERFELLADESGAAIAAHLNSLDAPAIAPRLFWCAFVDESLSRSNHRRPVASDCGAYDAVSASLAAIRKLIPSHDTSHGDDFRSVKWFGTSYSFTANQAACVRVLWDHWERGTPEVADETLLQAVDHEAPPDRLNVLFRGSPAWKAMIVEGSTKGTHRLVEPT